jgi:hypothetical protein
MVRRREQIVGLRLQRVEPTLLLRVARRVGVQGRHA